MDKITKNDIHLTSSQNLTEISDNEWKIIERQKNSYILSDDYDISFLKYPGYIFSNEEAKDCYTRIHNDFIADNIYTPSRGNLSKNNNYI